MTKGSNDITKTGNVNENDQDDQKHGAKGQIKRKGNNNMEDNEIKGFLEKGLKGWPEIQ